MNWVVKDKLNRSIKWMGRFMTIVLFMGLFISCRSQSNGWVPCNTVIPKYYWSVSDIKYGSTSEDPYAGLRKHLLYQSMSGLSYRAVMEKKGQIALWDGTHPTSAYENSEKDLLEMGIQKLGNITTYELAMLPSGKKGSVKDVFDGYILTDLEAEIESGMYATNAAHVYNAIIVDVRDKDMFDKAGYKMILDARGKTTADAWKEFKNQCDNSALVFIHVDCGELRDYAIAHNYFAMNINKRSGTKEFGSNWEMMKDVLAWLQPNAPCYGADAGNDEGEVDELISLYGCHWIPYDWGYNTDMTSINYAARQKGTVVKSIDPRKIDYSKDKKFVSYYLSDGDNLQWMKNTFNPDWYPVPAEYAKYKLSYGMCVINLADVAPAQMKYFCEIQDPEISIFERGSYYFIDLLGALKDREAILKEMAQIQAESMKKHGVKILGTVTRGKVDSPEAIEGYQAMIDANDELEGIIAIAYAPYADSKQEIIWVTNKKGIDIPVIMTTYCLWNKGTYNDPDEGTPAYISRIMKEDGRKFSLVCLHCWSHWRDTGLDDDELAENVTSGAYDSIGIKAEGFCQRRLGEEYEAVNLQEFIWRVRMEYRPDQTKKVLGLS